MRQRVVNLEEVTQSLKPFLEQYLQEHGYDTSKHFNCINPKHTDNNGSMSTKGDKGYHVANCFGCGTAADIFTAAHFIENKPIKGPAFIEENVLYLAEKFGVQLNLADLTPDEIYEYRTYEAYKYAAKLIADPEFGDYSMISKEIDRRGWDPQKCSEWGIGTVNYSDYKAKMKAAGYDVQFLQGVDLDRSNLFDSHNLLFTVNDDFGRPVGFSAKNLKYNKDNPNSKKYINTRGTGLECAIFKKGSRLYGFDIAKNASSPLYIFEGQADVITGRHHGLMNCCCTLGTALTDHHINLLKKHGIFNIILVFDSDEAGEKAALRALDTKFSSEKDFRVKLIQLPEGQDPDDLLRDHGIDEFVRLKKWSAFEWRMVRFMDEVGDDEDEDKSREIAEKMAKIIVTEKSHVHQEQMAKQVAKMTGFTLQAIMSEVKRLRNEKESAVQEKKQAAVEALMYEMRKNPEDIELALVQCQSAITDINKSTGEKTGRKTILDLVMNQKEHDENRTSDFAGFKMRPEGLGNIAAKLDDDWTTGSLVFVGGSEQAGKTTFCTQMAYEIVTENEDVVCIYHSIDDAARFILYKWVCQATNELQLELNHVSNPNYWASQEGCGWIQSERDAAYKKVIDLVKEGRLILSDATNGSSLAYAESLVKEVRENHPTKKIVLFVDNFHKLPDYSEINGHERVKRLSNHLKNMTVANNITVVATVEYRKLQQGEKPSNLALAESRSLAYDASVIIHLFNELHMEGEYKSVLVHEDDRGKILPRIWCKFGKNKVSGFEGRVFLDLFPSSASYRSVDTDQAEADQRNRLSFIKDNNESLM